MASLLQQFPFSLQGNSSLSCTIKFVGFEGLVPCLVSQGSTIDIWGWQHFLPLRQWWQITLVRSLFGISVVSLQIPWMIILFSKLDSFLYKVVEPIERIPSRTPKQQILVSKWRFLQDISRRRVWQMRCCQNLLQISMKLISKATP